MFDFHATQLNEVFLEALGSEEMRKEAEQKGAEFLRMQIYEDSFMERIMPAQTISPQMCDRDIHSPNLQVVIDKEFTDVKATTATFRGKADYEYVETERYAVQFHKIESPEYGLYEGELMSMRMPVQNLIRQHIAYHIRKKMDEVFIGMVNKAIADSGNVLTLSNEKRITPEVLVALRNILDAQGGDNGSYRQAATLLMTRAQFNNIYTWIQTNSQSGVATMPGITSGLTTDFWRDGYKYEMLNGLRVVTSVKSDLVKHNEIYVFTEPEQLGHHFTFNDDKFSIEKHHDEIKLKGYRSFSAAIGNNLACRKVVHGQDSYVD